MAYRFAATIAGEFSVPGTAQTAPALAATWMRGDDMAQGTRWQSERVNPARRRLSFLALNTGFGAGKEAAVT